MQDRSPLPAQHRAEASTRHLLTTDKATQGIGARVERIAPGQATLSMTVQPHMLNGHSMCHGGYIFMLADSAFAVACNSGNQVTVAQSNQITYMSPGQAGERLRAEAHEVAQTGRSGTFDVRVTGEDGRVVALFRGLSRQMGKPHFSEGGPQE